MRRHLHCWCEAHAVREARREAAPRDDRRVGRRREPRRARRRTRPARRRRPRRHRQCAAGVRESLCTSTRFHIVSLLLDTQYTNRVNRTSYEEACVSPGALSPNGANETTLTAYGRSSEFTKQRGRTQSVRETCGLSRARGNYGGTPLNELTNQCPFESLKFHSCSCSESSDLHVGGRAAPLHLLHYCAQSTPDTPYLPRHVGLRIGVPEATPAYGVARLCGTGLQALACAAADMTLDPRRRRVALVGGVESMSIAPYTLSGRFRFEKDREFTVRLASYPPISPMFS